MDFINCFLNIGLIAAFGERTLLIYFNIVSFFFSKFNWIGSAFSLVEFLLAESVIFIRRFTSNKLID